MADRQMANRAAAGRSTSERLTGERLTADRRTVGELLREADIGVRMLLIDVDARAAPGLVRTWAEVVEAGVDLMSALPPTSRQSAGLAPQVDVTQLGVTARSLHRNEIRRSTPSAGTFDQRLVDIAATLTRAADLVARHRIDVRPVRTAAAERDLAAARTSVLHTLYLTTHAVAVSVREHQGWATQHLRKAHGVHQLEVSQHALGRLDAFEQLVGSYLGSPGTQPGVRHAADLAGKVVDQPEDTARLEHALSGWDIQAHRSLAAAPTPANLALVTRTQAALANATLVILDAVATAGHLSPGHHTERLSPVLEASQQAWSGAARDWLELTTPTSTVSPDLAHAAHELRAALRQIAHDQHGWAAADVIASRIDLTRTAVLLLRASAAAADVAHLTGTIAADDHLEGPARVLLDLAKAAVGPSPNIDVGAPAAAWVSAADVHANRMVPVPPPVRAALVRNSTAATDAAARLSNAIGYANPPTPEHDPLTRSRRVDVLTRASTPSTTSLHRIGR